MTIAIIGAGIAGLSAATRLKAAGRETVLFDKGRGPGGRMSTRRAETEHGQMQFDHGAQYFTARSAAFQAQVEAWLSEGVVADWTARHMRVTAEGKMKPAEAKARYVGLSGMNGIIKAMAADESVSWGRRVQTLHRDAGQWTLIFEDGSEEAGFEAVIIAVPAEQVADLVGKHDQTIADAAQSVISDPCWTLMLGYGEALPVEWDSLAFAQGPLGWIARNGSKPGRAALETVVVQASPDWSKAHLEMDKTEIETLLLQEAGPYLSSETPAHMSAHRWRYSQPQSKGQEFDAYSKSMSLGVCGDWVNKDKIEGAWQSGLDLAETILSA